MIGTDLANSSGTVSKGKHNSISVMLVDDSAVIRNALTTLLADDARINIVASVANGQDALQAVSRQKTDIIILDIEMPVMDGITALPKLLEQSPNTKIVMFSSLTEKGADITLKALTLGAVECLVKPSSGEAKKGSDFQKRLIHLLRDLCPIPKSEAHSPTGTAGSTQKKSLLSADHIELRKNPMDYTGKPNLVAIGSSTGGPQALFQVLESFTDFDIPIIITQHMPATFTKILAEHISQKTGLPAEEGADGTVLKNGHVYVAPGNFHMRFEKDGLHTKIKLDQGPQENFCRPAVDPMMRSALEIYGKRMLGVILTGMGNDGEKGCKALVDAHARVIAQDEYTSTVWGMPGAVAKAGICSEILPLSDIGPWIKKAVTGK